LPAADFRSKINNGDQESRPDVAFIDNGQELNPLTKSNAIFQMWGLSRFTENGWWVLFRSTQNMDAARAFIRWLSRSPRWNPPPTMTASISLEEVQAVQTISRRAVGDFAQARFSDLWSIMDPAGAHFQERVVVKSTLCQAGPVTFTRLDTDPLLTFGNSRLAFALVAAVGAGEKVYGMTHYGVVLRRQNSAWKVLLLLPCHRLPSLVEMLSAFDRMGLQEGKLPSLSRVELVAPVDHARLRRLPQPPYIEWERVNGNIVSYLVESQFRMPQDEQSWSTSWATLVPPQPNGHIRVEFPFAAGTQPHRWRVWAISIVGGVSVSEWRVIDFTA
jgi:hypothetical protein